MALAFAASAALQLALFAQPVTAGAPNGGPAGLIDCLGKTQVRPAAVVLTCADANMSVRHLSWTGWGASFAAALGEMSVNSCTPNCAAGTFHTFKVVLIARGAERCGNVLAYNALTFAFLGRSPFPATSDWTLHPTITYRCR